MPKLFKFGNYYVYFWSNENDEPIHVHISKGKPVENATKIWLTRSGGHIVAHNKSKIPAADLAEILEAIDAYFFFICSEWKAFYAIDEIKFYC